jgi:cytochrome c
MIFLLAALTSVCALEQARPQSPEGTERGRELYDRRCSGCHALDRDDEGPRLRSVFGRQAGSVPGFKYSAALKASKLIWDQALLNKWLANPDDLIPGNTMDYQVSDAEQRSAILEYLRSIASK